MAFLANVSTQREILWGSDFESAVAMGFFIAFLFVYGSFNNILKIDELEFENNLQASVFVFKRKIPFIFSESGSKNVFSKKTFILEIVGYFTACIILTLFVVSLFLDVDAAFTLAFVAIGMTIPYVFVVGVFQDRTEKKAREAEKEAKKKLNIEDDEDEDE